MDKRITKIKVSLTLTLSFPRNMSVQEAVKQFTEKNNFALESAGEVTLLNTKSSTTYTNDIH